MSKNKIIFTNDSGVNCPNYYAGDDDSNISRVSGQCAEWLRILYGDIRFLHYCEVAPGKYMWRHMMKNGVQDLEKGMWYTQYALDELNPSGEDLSMLQRNEAGLTRFIAAWDKRTDITAIYGSDVDRLKTVAGVLYEIMKEVGGETACKKAAKTVAKTMNAELAHKCGLDELSELISSTSAVTNVPADNTAEPHVPDINPDLNLLVYNPAGTGTLDWIYFNPDWENEQGRAVGQFVDMYIDMDIIRKGFVAAECTLFTFISEEGKQNLADNADYSRLEFDGYEKDFMAALNGDKSIGLIFNEDDAERYVLKELI